MPDKPFTDADIDRCENGLAGCADARKLIERARRCGQNCDGHAQTIDWLEKGLQGFREEFKLSRQNRPLD